MIIAQGKGYRIHNYQGSEISIDIFGEISDWWGVNIGNIARQLIGSTSPLRVRLSSPGGDLLQGFGIMNLLRDYPGEVTVDVVGLAASAASFILMGADRVVMNPGSFLMIHNPATMAYGDAGTLESQGEALRKMEEEMGNVYVSAMRKREKYQDKTDEELTGMVKEWMNKETWFTPQEAIASGFADEISNEPQAVSDEAIMSGASAVYSNFQNTPQRVTNMLSNMSTKQETLLEKIEAGITALLSGKKVQNEAAEQPTVADEEGAEKEEVTPAAPAPQETEEESQARIAAEEKKFADAVEAKALEIVARANAAAKAAANPAQPKEQEQQPTGAAARQAQVRAKAAKAWDEFATKLKK
jgi:ATP-dependent protease ClpP protease subunit